MGGILTGCAHGAVLSERAAEQVLRVFIKYSELQSWTTNQLWNGQEAPDYSGDQLSAHELEKLEYPIGPYRTDLYLRTNVQRAKVGPRPGPGLSRALSSPCRAGSPVQAWTCEPTGARGVFDSASPGVAHPVPAAHRTSSLSCPRS